MSALHEALRQQIGTALFQALSEYEGVSQVAVKDYGKLLEADAIIDGQPFRVRAVTFLTEREGAEDV